MDSLRKTVHTCGGSLRRILREPRFYVALLWFVFLIINLIVSIRDLSALSGVKSSPWVFPLVTRSSGNQMFIIIGALLIFCDAPFLHSGSEWQILRAGRKSWFWGNMLYIWVTAFIYALGLAILPMLLLIPRVELMGGWGKVLGSFAQGSVFGGESLSYELMVQYPPVKAMLLTLLPVWLNAVLIGMVNYVFNLLTKRGFGALVSVVLGLSPMMLSGIRVTSSIAYYLSPPLWMNLDYYKTGGYGAGVTFAYAYGVLLSLIALCTAVSYIGVKKKDLIVMEEI